MGNFKNWMSAFTLLALTFTAHAQNAEKLDAYFDALEANDKFLGTVALLKDGEVVYTRQTGMADMDEEVVAEGNTKYRIGSITKTFTSVLVLKAVEEGKLSLDQKLSEFYPEVTNADKITISHLLYHRSGIHNFTNDQAYMSYHQEAKSQADMMQIIVDAGSDFEPDSKSDYSNSNYVILSYILERVYESSYADILTKKITKKLKLKDTKFGGKISVADGEANSYVWLENWNKQSETDTSIPMGAGGIISTATDLVKFAEGLFTYKLISKESVDQMKVLKDQYGMGLIQLPFNKNVGYGHTGGIDGFRSVFGYFSELGYGMAVISNGANYNTNLISIALLSGLFGQEIVIPDFTEYAVNADDIPKYVGVYASPSFPLKVTISKAGDGIKAQATGQPPFDLLAKEKDVFTFEQAGIVLEFSTEDGTMTLKQGGGKYVLSKE